MSTVTSDLPIGVFDSGVGGLSVLRAIRAQLPNDDLLYVADSKHMPYGERDANFIHKRCHHVAQFLCQQPVKALVVACNTASVVAIDSLRDQFNIPIVGIEPAIKPAASVTRSGVVGVLATSRTLQSLGVARLCELYAKNVEMILMPCPGFVEKIEKAEFYSNETRDLLDGFIAPLLKANADTIVLGCTHYPFVRELIESMVGNQVTIVEPGAAVARQLVNRLSELGLQRIAPIDDSQSRVATDTFYTTGIES